MGTNNSGTNFSQCFLLSFFSVKTNPTKSARNFGIIFDKHFTFRSHISAVCSSYFYHTWVVWRILHYRDLDSAKLFATALVSSRLHYCNPLFSGMADTDLSKLQRVQNQRALLWQSHLLLLAVFHCFVLFICCQQGLEYCLRSVCWPTKPFTKTPILQKWGKGCTTMQECLLSCPPATFQNMLKQVSQCLLWQVAVLHIDDIAVIDLQHLDHLYIVSDRLKKAGLKLKCVMLAWARRCNGNNDIYADYVLYWVIS